MKNRLKYQALKDLQYWRYLKILSNCTRQKSRATLREFLNVTRRVNLILRSHSSDRYASVNSSSAHPPPPGNRGAFAQVVIPGGGASASLSRPGDWAFAYPGATPGHSTHVFWKVPWMSSSRKTRRLSNNGLSVKY